MKCECGRDMAPIDKVHKTCWMCRVKVLRADADLRRAKAEAMPMPDTREGVVEEIRKLTLADKQAWTVRIDHKTLTLDEYAKHRLTTLGCLQSLLVDMRMIELCPKTETP